MSDSATNDEKPATLLDVAQEGGASGEAMGLIGALVAGSMQQNIGTLQTLWEGEKRRRQALEVRLERFLWAAQKAYMGSVREYEAAINLLRYPDMDDRDYAALHEENDRST